MLTSERSRNERGITLVEIIVVMVILVIMGAIVVPQFGTARNNVNEGDAVSAAHSLQQAVEAFRVDHGGRVPSAQVDWAPNAIAKGPYDSVSVRPYMRSGEPDGVGRGSIYMTAVGPKGLSGASATTKPAKALTVAYVANDETTYTITVYNTANVAKCQITNSPTPNPNIKAC